MKEEINEVNIKLAEEYLNKINTENNNNIIDMFLDWILENDIKFNRSEIVALINNDNLLRDNISSMVNDANFNFKKYNNNKRTLIKTILDAFKLVEELNEFENDLTVEKETNTDIDSDDDLINMCLNNSPKRLLSKDEVVALYKQYHKGSIEAKDILVKYNLRLVLSIARRYQNYGLDIEDLFQIGCEGLMIAIEKYDYKLGFAFSTYATWWIRQNITRAIANESRTIRIPVNVHEDVLKLKREMATYYLNHGKMPNEEELARLTSLSASRLEIALEQIKSSIISLNTPTGESEETELGDLIVDEESSIDDFDSDMENKIFYEEVNKLFENSHLTEREKEVIRYRFGFYDGKCYTLEEVGKIHGVTRERVRQIEKHGLRKLKLNSGFRELNKSLGLDQQNLFYR